MKGILAIGCLVVTIVFSYGQNNNAFHSGIQPLYAAGSIANDSTRGLQVDSAWSAFRQTHRIPFIIGDSVAFLYRGQSKSVDWTGDFNGWGYDKNFDNKGRLISGTDIWILKTSFPVDARLDYKILLDGKTLILDLDNPFQQWSGIGGGSPNSELRMPEWKEDQVLLPRNDIVHGSLSEEILVNSSILGYQLSFSVYLPLGYTATEKFQSLYVTDGYEYLQPRLGNMITILDNLIADKKIRPIVAIFIDHREPINRSNNKRMDELAMNSKYLDFIAKELIPLIEKRYAVQTTSASRGIMGSSLGGLSAAYFAFSKPGIFGMAGIQSPSFNMRPQIYTICNLPDSPIKVSMTTGVISDASESTRKMKRILQANACQYFYREVNDGHSWGNWRNLIDDILVDLFGN